jgi:hypothetical protein
MDSLPTTGTLFGFNESNAIMMRPGHSHNPTMDTTYSGSRQRSVPVASQTVADWNSGAMGCCGSGHARSSAISYLDSSPTLGADIPGVDRPNRVTSWTTSIRESLIQYVVSGINMIAQ